MTICRYCDKPVNNPVVTISYWGGLTFYCHAECKQAGLRSEAFECQCIDADCNDCKHFIREKMGINKSIWYGQCKKFNKLTEAYPNKWRGLECFEHRKG
jgi:hypothetical protein